MMHKSSSKPGKWAAVIFVLVCSDATRALTPLADEVLSGVVGKDGVSIVMEGAAWSAQSLDYVQDGNTLSVKGLSGRPVAGEHNLSTLTVDTMPDHLALALTMAPTELRVDNITMGSGLKGYGGLRLFGQGNANLKIKSSGEGADEGLSLSGTAELSNGTGYVRADGFDLIAKGLRLGASFNDATLKLPLTASGNDIKFEFQNAGITAGFSALGLDVVSGDPAPGDMATPSSPDMRLPNSDASFGSFSLDLKASGSVTVSGGGAANEGLRVTPNVSWNSGIVEYKRTGVVRVSDFSGGINSSSGVTFDLEQDALGSYVKLAAADLAVNARLGKLVVGNPGNQQLGGVGIDLNFQDSLTQQNWLKLRPGGDVNIGNQGLTADLSWNLANGSASITDNNNTVWLSGLTSYGTGSVTMDLTRGCTNRSPTPGCYAGTLTDMNKGSYNGHYDGLRLGFSDVKGSYSFEGLRVGSSTAPIQGGTELLLFAGLYPAYDFQINGNLTLLPGGKGVDGIGFNADLFFTESNAALSADESGKGIWLTGMNQEMHYRDGSVDVSDLGLVINKGEYWSKLNASDLRLGSKTKGRSFGRVMLRTYEKDSSLTLATGGSGGVCIGAGGAIASTCSKNGGRWEDRGDEGLSVKLKTVLVRDKSATNTTVKGVVTDEKRNQFLFETRRKLDADGEPINGTGVQAVLDNFWSSDGSISQPEANTFGVVADLGVDVAPTIVKSKTPPHTRSEPLGFAVSGRFMFKEIGVDRLQTVHPTRGAQTMLYGMRVQNADVRFNLTATPIQ